MASEEAKSPDSPSDPPSGWPEKMKEKWVEMKEHAETYPFVWGSYILVYGGLTAYLSWRWRKLRRTEDRVRALSLRLRQLAEAEQPPPPPPAGKNAAE